jgi:hypothetical protein
MYLSRSRNLFDHSHRLGANVNDKSHLNIRRTKMALKEYKTGTAFNGVIGRTFGTSEPAWPEPNRAKETDVL